MNRQVLQGELFSDFENAVIDSNKIHAYRAITISNALGVPLHRLEKWDSQRIIVPSLRSPQSTRRLYSMKDALLIMTVQELLDKGFSQQEVAVIVSTISAYPLNVLKNVVVHKISLHDLYQQCQKKLAQEDSATVQEQPIPAGANERVIDEFTVRRLQKELEIRTAERAQQQQTDVHARSCIK
ncbi:MAG: MerR family transcriptional regulator [Aeriscardovia sp.]|nr:MerR family transcriptional regulator [Aeriscardovia sp.]